MLPGVAWPAWTGDGQQALALLARTEAQSPGALREGQLRQLRQLIAHARATTRYGRRVVPEGTVDWDLFARIPLLERRELQGGGRALRAERVPKEHGAIGVVSTSGSTGTPVRAWKTALNQHVWDVLTARDHVWHRRDTSEPLAAIRFHPDATWPGIARHGWGRAADLVGPRGPARMLHLVTPVDQQVAWLDREPFARLLTFPSNLAEILGYCEAHGKRWPRLRAVMTVAEPVTPELRARCREVLGVPIEDQYSTQEVGHVALECPDGHGWHVQSEAVLVEVLRDDGTACGVGEVGRVVLTPLHAFAMPLVRYAVGDHAEVGGPCPCGRPHPLLTRIAGRTRNLVRRPDGSRVWPTLGSAGLMRLAPVVQHQLVQHAVDDVEVRLVVRRPVTPPEEDAMRAHLAAHLPGVGLRFSYPSEIARGAGGKFEDFVSRVP